MLTYQKALFASAFTIITLLAYAACTPGLPVPGVDSGSGTAVSPLADPEGRGPG